MICTCISLAPNHIRTCNVIETGAILFIESKHEFYRIIYLFLFTIKYFIVVLLQLFQFSTLCSTLPIPPHSLSQSLHCCPYPWVIHTCSQTGPFLFPLLSTPCHLLAVSLFLVSMPLVLFYSFVCFVHQVPLTGEIIWYLSFTAWIILLSIMLFSSIHAVSKGRSSFFLSAAQYSLV